MQLPVKQLRDFPVHPPPGGDGKASVKNFRSEN